MKRALALILALLMLACTAAAEEENWYLQTAKELTRRVGELAVDENYIKLYYGADFSCLDELRQADFEHPVSAWRYATPPLRGVLALLGAQPSDAAMEYLESRVPTMALDMYAGKFGVESLTASTVLCYSRSYLLPEGFEPCIVALELDHGAVAVAFYRTGESSITAAARPLIDDQSPLALATGLGASFPLNMREMELAEEAD